MALIRTPNTYARPAPWIALILVVAGALAFVNRESLAASPQDLVGALSSWARSQSLWSSTTTRSTMTC